MTRRSRAEAVAATSVLVAESAPARLDQMLRVVAEARVFVVGARTTAVALTVIERNEVDLVLVAEDFDGGRALELARAGHGRPCVLVCARRDERAPRQRPGFVRTIAWPFDAEAVETLVASRRAYDR